MTITIKEAMENLEQLIDQLVPGEEILITRGEVTIARISRVESWSKEPRKLGLQKGSVPYMAADFDAPLPEMAEYMD